MLDHVLDLALHREEEQRDEVQQQDRPEHRDLCLDLMTISSNEEPKSGMLCDFVVYEVAIYVNI